jgi:beta-glucanase (GH16 family)
MLFTTTASVAFACTALTCSAAPAEKVMLGTCVYTRLFSEDFQNFHVHPWRSDGEGWIAHTPWAGDFGDAAFTDPRPGFPFIVKDGVLNIEAQKDQGGKWHSGLIASADGRGIGFSQLYGYFEFRAKLPAGDGTWPAFWLASVASPPPRQTSIEIDIMEHYGRSPADFHSVVHIWNADGSHPRPSASHITPVPSGSLYSDFHNYGVDVEPDLIIVYFDRKEVWRTATPAEHQRPLLILADLALGSGWPIDKVPNPSIMQIAYIHTFTRDHQCL